MGLTDDPPVSLSEVPLIQFHQFGKLCDVINSCERDARSSPVSYLCAEAHQNMITMVGEGWIGSLGLAYTN